MEKMICSNCKHWTNNNPGLHEYGCRTDGSLTCDSWRSKSPPKPKWPESRIDVIGQNGNDGDHYEEIHRYDNSI